jgi:hypothetical protein
MTMKPAVGFQRSEQLAGKSRTAYVSAEGHITRPCPSGAAQQERWDENFADASTATIMGSLSTMHRIWDTRAPGGRRSINHLEG